MTNPLIRNYISCSENALKLTYSNVEFQNFPGEDPRTPRFQGRGKDRREAKKTAPPVVKSCIRPWSTPTNGHRFTAYGLP